MLQLYAQTPKTKLTAAQMLTAARNRNTRIWSQAGHISLHPEHGVGVTKILHNTIRYLLSPDRRNGLKFGILACSLMLNPSAADFIRYPKTDTEERREELASRLLKCSW